MKFTEYSFVTMPSSVVIDLEEIAKRKFGIVTRKSSPFERKIDLLKSIVDTIRDAV